MPEIKDFCQNLGSISPTPGGGAAAGVCLSMGAACAEKAARFSLGDNIKTTINSFIKIREIGLKLSEEDQIAFLGWQEARKLPQKTEKEKKIRQKRVNFFASECTRIPLTICKNALLLTELIKDFIPFCNKWLISDAGVGASFSKAAFESGIFNININIPYIEQKEFIQEIDDFINTKTVYFNKITENIFDHIQSGV